VVAESGGVTTEYPADEVISSMPLSLLLRAMDPPVPPEVQRAADALAFRDFLTVALVVPADKVPWDDTWIYIHAPEVKTMRVQNFGSWSPLMVKDCRNVLGLEYTLHEGDEAWTASDDGQRVRREFGAGRPPATPSADGDRVASPSGQAGEPAAAPAREGSTPMASDRS
jgi:protoporphyrinogen oxidase